MALEKSITLASGVTGDYHRVHALRWDPMAKELQCAIALYKDAATAADVTKVPLVHEFARLRILGSEFDTRMAKAVLAAASDDIVALIYLAIKDICDDYNTSPVTNLLAYVKCDAGNGFYHDATDV